ncbi:hypothetical protein MGN01_23980 [Methylobacterium gnaphalii]|uniref:Uncharacterized protein n=1 Tax=Methylobacterium gnaphalii TaxID=1010610 RepID=A0A512JKW6_9HYPH|nr:hypothetical protein MGN01_23980 [Methylobacterium gnaphalii]
MFDLPHERGEVFRDTFGDERVVGRGKGLPNLVERHTGQERIERMTMAGPPARSIERR